MVSALSLTLMGAPTAMCDARHAPHCYMKAYGCSSHLLTPQIPRPMINLPFNAQVREAPTGRFFTKKAALA